MMSDRYLYKAKRTDNGEWVEGNLIRNKDHSFIAEPVKFSYVGYCYECDRPYIDQFEVDSETICQCALLTEKSDSEKIWENEIYNLYDVSENANLTGIVRFGKYEQDGSGGEYPSTPVFGFYFEVIKVQYPEEGIYDDEEDYPEWNRKISILEILDEKFYINFECIGNIFDNPELLKGE